MITFIYNYVHDDGHQTTNKVIFKDGFDRNTVMLFGNAK